MLIFDALAFATGAALIWTGATGRLTTIVTDGNGEDAVTDIGNYLAIGGGLCVLVSVLV